jgi:hypothetical protein
MLSTLVFSFSLLRICYFSLFSFSFVFSFFFFYFFFNNCLMLVFDDVAELC